MKCIRVIAFAAALVLLLSVPAGGGDASIALLAKIPFEFTVGNQAFPAGTYYVGLPSLLVPGVLGFGGEFEKMNHRILTLSAPAVWGDPSLVFRRYRYENQIGAEQNAYFLFRVNMGAGEVGRELVKSKAERAIESEARQHPLRSTSGNTRPWAPEIVSVAASR